MNPVKLSAVAVAAMMLTQGSLLSCQLAAPCKTQDLAISGEGGEKIAAGGMITYNYILTNQGKQPCTLSGYPTAIALGGDRLPVREIHFKRSLGAVAGPADQHAGLVPLARGAHAWFQVDSNDCMGCDNAGQLSLCKKTKFIRITPPENKQPFRPLAFMTCTPSPGISFLLPGRP